MMDAAVVALSGFLPTLLYAALYVPDQPDLPRGALPRFAGLDWPNW